ncbi:hypothetical protein H5J25_17345 [Sphingomonas aliaeris]|uniref:DUF1570 domain-containing protein n=1 Tax=Sphingomonas aliaeris TaxID=2759526 RepID=A0A974S405_9SPHN|nr:hypothetical protein [Sphingomonas aliaeris]QQV77082.1 hypothetical protein H5J25_17345 [Sphingomonas aliaeris]
MRVFHRAIAGIALFCATFCAAPALADWREASSDHFLIYANSDERWLRDFADRLERVDGAMRLTRAVENVAGRRSNRLTIYVLPNVTAVQQMCGKNCKNVAGFYVPRAGGSIAFTPRQGSNPSDPYDLNANTVLFHEYAHHIMLENFAAAYPRWFVEGFAEFNSTAKVERNGAVQLGGAANHRAYGLVLAQPLPIATLLEDSKAKLSAAQQDVFYGRAWLLAHMLTFDAARSGQLSTYLQLINQGKPSLEAAQTAFGDLKTLARDMEKYLNSRTLSGLLVPPDRLKIGRIDLRTLSPGEAETMAVRMRSKRGVSRPAALALLPEARRRARDFPNDPAAQGVLAEAEYDAGNVPECEAAADRALAADPKYVQALLYKGRARIRRAVDARSKDPAVWKEARSWLIKANRIDTDDAEPLMMFYESFLVADQKPSDSAVAGLMRAFELSPHDAGLRLMAIRQTLTGGDVKEARYMLIPLAFDPHAPRDNMAAKMVAMIDAGSPAPAVLATMRTKDEPAPE